MTGILTGNVRLIGESLDRDVIIEPVRAPLIPGMMAVKEAAKAAGEGPRRPRALSCGASAGRRVICII